MSQKRITTRFRVTLGLAGLTLSMLLSSLLIGLIPDRQQAMRFARATLAEAIAVQSSSLLTPRGIPKLEQHVDLLVERNPDLLSIGFRRADGLLILSAGDDHESAWELMTQDYTSDNQVRVPLYSADRNWGELELRYKPYDRFLGIRLAHADVLPLLAFVTASCFLVFFFYLGKMLKQLDPSSAIPPRVRSALDTMAEGLMVVDLRGHVVLANNALANMLGNEVEELMGTHANRFDWMGKDGTRFDGTQAPWSVCLASGELQRNDTVKLVDHEGVERTFLVNCTPVMSSANKHGGALVSFDDVTQLEAKKIELSRARDSAEAANQAKSDFLANMSHEIRTPMNAILGFTDVLRRGYGRRGMDPRKHLDTIHSSGQHLLRLINDILDLSKVEAGQLDIEQIECAPYAIAREVIQILSVRAEEKGISLSLAVDGQIPQSMLSDPSRLRQIITNLVGNAIKFTETGGVTITMSLVDTPKSMLRIDVTDTGIGMTEEQLSKIFDPFSQADSTVTRRFGGTGLGLTISRRFAQAMGGQINVASQVGMGSTFTVTIETGPLDHVTMLDSNANLDSFSSSSHAGTQWVIDGGRVLVVDDGEANRDLVGLVLEEAGLEVEMACDGQEGSDRAINESFDLVLMDMQMPIMDGYAATRRIREHGVKTPIYALTANAMKGFEQACLDAGCDGFLTKPIDIDRLLENVAQVLGGQQEPNAQQVSRPSASDDVDLTPSDFSDSGPTMAPLVSQLPNIAKFNELVERFIPRLEEQLQTMEKAVAAENHDELAGLAHWLKGAGGTVGFPAFTEPATLLESAAKQQATGEYAALLAELKQLAARIQISTAAGTA